MLTVTNYTPLNNRNFSQNNSSKMKTCVTPSFSGVDRAADDIVNSVKGNSKFFKFFNDRYDKLTDSIADKFTSRVVEFKPLTKLAERLQNHDNLFQHCLTVGSVITSGLYMQRTLANDNLDKDRKNTLAVNQGLTFLLSTIGAYALDKYVKGWWDNVTAKFAGHLLGDPKFYQKYLDDKNAINLENKKLLQEAKKTGVKAELKSLPKITKLVEDHAYYKTLLKTSEDGAKTLMTKVKGMSPLRSMIVFGFVYRYFVPVVVTKPANFLCEKYLAHKKAQTGKNVSVKQ